MKGTLDPNRTLYPDDLNHLLALNDYVIDKRHDDVVRSWAISGLQYYCHKHALPAYLAVVHDDSNPSDLRVKAVHAMCGLPDKRVADHYITLITDEDYNVASKAYCWLFRITGRPAAMYHVLNRDAQSSEREKTQKEWREWWKKNRESVTLRVGQSFGGGLGAGCLLGPQSND